MLIAYGGGAQTNAIARFILDTAAQASIGDQQEQSISTIWGVFGRLTTPAGLGNLNPLGGQDRMALS